MIFEHGHQLQGKDIAFLSGVEGMSTLNPLRGSRSSSSHQSNTSGSTIGLFSCLANQNISPLC